MGTEASLLAAFKQTQFIVKDQEQKNLRDMKVLLVTYSQDKDIFKDVYMNVCFC